MAGNEIVVVFDFDSTIIECDSDNWLLDNFGLTENFYQLLPTTPWNPLMDRMMNELHSQGKTIEDILQVLRRTPVHPRIVPTIQAAHSLGCELKIVSDANMFFIETILKHHGIWDCFSEITANPSYVVKEEGRLRIFPYHDYLKSCHGCSLCPPNMCKGIIIERLQAEGKNEKKVIYIGDGKGDYCPSLKLKESDHVLPRKNFPLLDLVTNINNKIEAEVHGWSDGEELEHLLLQIIQIQGRNKSNSAAAFSADCKLGSIPIDAHEALPKALPVPI